jgi:hypothetical protein
MKLKDSELKAILAEVETEIATLLKSEGDALRLAKGDGDDKNEGSDPSATSAPAEGTPAPGQGAPPAEGAPDASATDPSASPDAPPAEASSPAPDAPPADGSAPAPDAAPADPAMDAGPVDPAALQAEYSKLPPEELKAHYMAAKSALFELMGAGAASPDASAVPAASPSPSPAPAASPSPSPAPVPPPALKAEVPASIKKVPANGGTEQAAIPDAIKKSEEKVADLEKQIELMAQALDLALGTPMRKAVTSVNHIPRTEDPKPQAKELSKSEIKDKVRTAVGSGKLTKSQKDLLFSYALGNVDFAQVKDLLEVK